MNETITRAELQQRRQELQALVARENEQAEIKRREVELHKANTAAFAARINEIDLWLKRPASPRKSENVIPMRQLSLAAGETKQSLRYRSPGATTDIVMLIYDSPGIEFDQLTLTVHERYRQQGTTRDTVNKMVRRLVREGYARRDGSKLFLTEICRAAWEASPLYRAS